MFRHVPAQVRPDIAGGFRWVAGQPRGEMPPRLPLDWNPLAPGRGSSGLAPFLGREQSRGRIHLWPLPSVLVRHTHNQAENVRMVRQSVRRCIFEAGPGRQRNHSCRWPVSLAQEAQREDLLLAEKRIVVAASREICVATARRRDSPSWRERRGGVRLETIVLWNVISDSSL